MCFCGDEYGRYSASNGCDVDCHMDLTQNCGGYSKNFIYNVQGGSPFACLFHDETVLRLLRAILVLKLCVCGG